ncbi:MAG TPA: YqgE/AlgH family protein [Bryobacteraceae bacterium]|nr:YqgE/AlgH family protein [Bryobacteraceae bacterium]
MWRRTVGIAVLLGGVAFAQYGEMADLGAGKLLIAKPELGDPNFAHTVILIVDYDRDKGTSGLILNRRTDVALSKLFPDTKTASSDPVFQGGPVEETAAQALLRSATKLDNATRLFGSVYVSGSKELIEKTVAAAPPASEFRLYVGYGGWGPGQLEHEIALGAWDVLNGRSNIVFDDDPDSLWDRLEKLAHARIAMSAPRFHFSAAAMTDASGAVNWNFAP